MGIKKINPEKWYSLTELADGLLPFLGTDIRRYRRFVKADRDGDNHLKAVITGDGKTKRYKFKGSNVIKTISAAVAGDVTA